MTAARSGLPERDEPALARAAQAGDRGALRTLFERHQDALFGYCLFSARRDRDRALDLLQETFTRAFRALPSLKDPERLRPWLFSIAANLVRTRGAQEEQRQRVLDAFELEAAPDDPAEAAERERRVAAVQWVLSNVADERLREIATLKYGEPEHTTRQIAEKLTIPHGTVTVKLMRFRAAVRRELCRALAAEGVTP